MSHKIMLTPDVEKRHSATVFKQDAPIKEFDDIERSILAVTSILQRMGLGWVGNIRLPPPILVKSNRFLCHLATFLTCGDENHADSKTSLLLIA